MSGDLRIIVTGTPWHEPTTRSAAASISGYETISEALAGARRCLEADFQVTITPAPKEGW